MGAEQGSHLPPGGQEWEVPESQRGLTPEIIRKHTEIPAVKLMLLELVGETPTDDELREAGTTRENYHPTRRPEQPPVPDQPSLLGGEKAWAAMSGALLGAGVIFPPAAVVGAVTGIAGGLFVWSGDRIKRREKLRVVDMGGNNTIVRSSKENQGGRK